MKELPDKIKLIAKLEGFYYYKFLLVLHIYIAYICIVITDWRMYALDGDASATLTDVLSIVILSEADNIVGDFYLKCYIFNTEEGSKFETDEGFLEFQFERYQTLTG